MSAEPAAPRTATPTGGPGAPPPSRHAVALTLSWPGVLGLLAFVAALWAQASIMVGVFYDDGIYVTAAKALASGLGYRNIHLPGAPPITHYPPLYPLVLSLAWRLWPSFPANVALLELCDAAALGGAAWLMAHHLRRRLPVSPPLAFVALAAGFVSFPLLSLLGVRMSEPLFLLLFAAAVAVADRDEPGVVTGALAGLLAGLATDAKSVGLSVVGGVVLALWLRRRRAAAGAALAAAAVVCGPWFLWVALHVGQVDPRLANYTSYLAEARSAGLGSILRGLAGRSLWAMAWIMLPSHGGVLDYPIAALVLAAFVWGMVVAAKRAPALVASLSLYLLVVSLWPFPPFRFVWIIYPWTFALIAAGCVEAWTRGRWARLLVAALVLSVLVGYGPREAVSLSKRRFASTGQEMSQSFRWVVPSIAQELPDSAVVASEDEALIYLYTGRHAVPSALFQWKGLGTRAMSPREHVRYWCDAGVTDILVVAPADAVTHVLRWITVHYPTAISPLFRITGAQALYRFRCPR